MHSISRKPRTMRSEIREQIQRVKVKVESCSEAGIPQLRAKKKMPDIKSKFSKWLFWDVADLSMESHRDFIIIRVLNDGMDNDLRRLKELFTDAEIIHAIQSKRGLSRRAALYWTQYYKVPYQRCKSLSV